MLIKIINNNRINSKTNEPFTFEETLKKIFEIEFEFQGHYN